MSGELERLRLTGLVVGWLVDRLRAETAVAEARAAEAEDLRDRLGHRADVLEAVNRAARALGSSLDQGDPGRLRQLLWNLPGAGSASTSPGRSPRRTAGRSTSSRPPAPARPSPCGSRSRAPDLHALA